MLHGALSTYSPVANAEAASGFFFPKLKKVGTVPGQGNYPDAGKLEAIYRSPQLHLVPSCSMCEGC